MDHLMPVALMLAEDKVSVVRQMAFRVVSRNKYYYQIFRLKIYTRANKSLHCSIVIMEYLPKEYI